MAVLRNIQPRAPLTTFAPTVEPGPNTFDLLAGVAQSAFEMFDPIATEQAQQQGLAEGGAAVGDHQLVDVPGARPGTLPPPGPSVSPDARDPRGGTMPTGANVLTTPSTTIDINPSTGRPAQPLLDLLASSAEQALGPGARVYVSSGHEGRSTGTRRHPAGAAGDVDFYRPDGTRVEYDAPEAVPLMQALRANGAQGIGYGGDYMGARMHVDIFDADASRGEGHSWGGHPGIPPLDEAAAGGAPIAYNAPPTATGDPATPVVSGQVRVRTEQGNLEMRPADLFTTRYDRVRQAAAAGAYSSRLLLDAESDLAEIQRRYPLNPSGFAQAAEAYVSQIVDNAPPMLRTALRMDLENEARTSLRGVRDAQHRDTMRRADNSNQELIMRYQERYIDSFASGDVDGAAEAMSSLQSQLRYRESLPGIGHTPELSENIMAGLNRSARDARVEIAEARQTEIGSQLTDIRQVAAENRRHENEAILGTPEAQNHPDYNRTMAAVNLRALRPDLRNMTPAQLDALIAEEEQRVIGEVWEDDYLDALRSIRDNVAQGLTEDPIAHHQSTAARVPQLTQFDGANADQVIRSFQARANFANESVAAGYTENARFFSNEEVTEFGAFLGPDADPTIRTAFANALIEGFGPQASQAARELGMEASAAQWVRLAQATGNRQELARAITGNALLREGQARPPSEAVVYDPSVVRALEALPPNASMRAMIIDMATDRSAYSEGMAEPTASEFMESVNAALGAQGDLGGIQTVQIGPSGIFRGGNSFDMLVPPGMSGDQIGSALSSAWQDPNTYELPDGRVIVTPPDFNTNNTSGFLTPIRRALSGEASMDETVSALGLQMYENQADADQYINGDRWGEAGPPMFNGEPLTWQELQTATLRPVMDGANFEMGLYEVQFTVGDVVIDAADADGNAYRVNLQSMMENSNVQPAR